MKLRQLLSKWIIITYKIRKEKEGLCYNSQKRIVTGVKLTKIMTDIDADIVDSFVRRLNIK